MLGFIAIELKSQCFSGMGIDMVLRHLRYFVAVAEAGSLTVAAEQTLHTSQPSLSRQIRDLEGEVGAQLLTRRARGIELTRTGRAFLDHARSGYCRLKRQAKLHAGSLIPPSRASRWAF
jgi:LysR family hca operon transcriptional activator